MGTKEGGACARAGATGVPQYLRRDDPGPTTSVDCRDVKRHLQLSERRFRAVKPDGGVP